MEKHHADSNDHEHSQPERQSQDYQHSISDEQLKEHGHSKSQPYSKNMASAVMNLVVTTAAAVTYAMTRQRDFPDLH
jgi:hypothetical protein